MRSEARSEKSELGQARRKVILRVFFMLRLPRKLIPHEPPRRHEPGRPPGSLYLSLLTGSARAGSAARNLESLPRPSRFLRAWFPLPRKSLRYARPKTHPPSRALQPASIPSHVEERQMGRLRRRRRRRRGKSRALDGVEEARRFQNNSFDSARKGSASGEPGHPRPEQIRQRARPGGADPEGCEKKSKEVSEL